MKKVLSVLICMVLLLSFLPISDVRADDTAASQTEENQINVTVIKNGVSYSSTASSGTTIGEFLYTNRDIAVAIDPEIGYEFDCWTDASGNQYYIGDVLSEDITLTVSYTEQTRQTYALDVVGTTDGTYWERLTNSNSKYEYFIQDSSGKTHITNYTSSSENGTGVTSQIDTIAQTKDTYNLSNGFNFTTSCMSWISNLLDSTTSVPYTQYKIDFGGFYVLFYPSAKHNYVTVLTRDENGDFNRGYFKGNWSIKVYRQDGTALASETVQLISESVVNLKSMGYICNGNSTGMNHATNDTYREGIGVEFEINVDNTGAVTLEYATLRQNDNVARGSLNFNINSASLSDVRVSLGFQHGHSTVEYGATQFTTGSKIKSNDGLVYEILNENEASVIGYNGVLPSVSLPSTVGNYNVISVGESAFENNEQITSVTFSSNIKTIEDRAFAGCTNLSEVAFASGNALESIGLSAFENCENLATCNLPQTVTSIGKDAFSCCTSLVSMAIPSSVTSIEVGTFYGCESLQITLASGLENIGDGAFLGCNAITEIALPETVVSVGESAFAGCKALETVVLQNGVTNIGAYAFMNCTALEDVAIGDSITQLKDGTFWGCTSLVNVTATNALDLDDTVFMGCENLTSTVKINSTGSHVYAYCQALENIEITTAPDTIEEYAFYGCASVAEVDIPNNITSIKQFAFDRCIGLEKVYVDTGLAQVDKYAFFRCDSLSRAVYSGNESQWNQIAFAIGNDYIADAYSKLVVFTVVNGNSDMGRVSTKPVDLSEIYVGDSVTMSATANDGYEFVEWVDGEGASVSTSKTYVVTATEAENYYKAVFEEKRKVDIVVTVVSFEQNGREYQYKNTIYEGDSFALSTILENSTIKGVVNAVDGYEFNGTWTVDGEIKDGGYQVTGNVTVVPNYTKKTLYYNLTIEGATGTQTRSIAYNTSVTTTEAQAGKDFTNWEENGKAVSFDKTYTFFVAYDRTIKSVTGATGMTPIILLNNIVEGDDGYTTIYSERTMPSEYTLVSAGIIMTKSGTLPVDSLVLEKVNGTTIKKGVTKSNSKNGQYAVVTPQADYIAARAYLVYEDADGVEHTIYSDVYTLDNRGIDFDWIS